MNFIPQFCYSKKQEGQDCPGLLTWTFEITLAIFFVAFREEFTRIFLSLYSASSSHSLIPCLLTKFREHFLKRVTQGTLLWNYFKIWPVVSEKKIFKEFVHVCIVNLAPIHQSHVHEWIKISLTTFEKGHSRNISANWGLEHTYSAVLTERTFYWTNWISLEHWQSYTIYSLWSIFSKGYIIQIFNQKRQFLCNVTHTCIKFFTKSIQIIQKGIAYFHYQWKY